MLATKTVRVNVYDFALFLKEDIMEIYQEYGEISNELDEIVSKFNDGIKKLSDGDYGYYEDIDCYWTPSTAVAMKAIKQIFGLHHSDNVMVVPSTIFVGCEKLWEFHRRPTDNSLRKKRWRQIGKLMREIARRYYPSRFQYRYIWGY